MSVVNSDNPVVNFSDKSFEGNTYSISFKLKINGDSNQTFNIFTLLNVKLVYDDDVLKLYYNNTHIRSLNINNNVFCTKSKYYCNFFWIFW